MVSIVDVARLADVSIKTVSRVVNGEKSVRDVTRERVRRAIDELNYQPHRGARLMRGRNSGLIGMITGAITASGHSPNESGLSAIHIVRGAQQVCRAAGKTLMIADTMDAQNEVGSLLRTFEGHSVEGVIYAADYHRQVVFPLSRSTPVVLANCFDSAGTPAVVPDDYLGQRLATELLLEQGHRQLAMIGLHDEVLAAHLRRSGYLDACRAWGLPYESFRYHAGSVEQHESDAFAPLSEALRSVLDSDELPTAIMFGNDLMAMRARPQLAAAGIDVPEQMSIVGFDNDIGICENLQPSLTTVTLPYLEIGCHAAEKLLQMSQPEQGVAIERVPCRIVARDSAFPIPRPPDNVNSRDLTTMTAT